MGVLNPGFEEEGALLGLAAHWTLHTYTSLRAIAGFGPTPNRPQDDFERWFELLVVFPAGSLALAFFDLLAEGFEDFSDGWGTDVYLTELPDTVVTAPFGGAAAEEYEAGWANGTYARDWSAVGAIGGQFAWESFEGFEKLWRGNHDYRWLWTSVPAVPAPFDSGEEREDFEHAWNTATTL